MSPFASLLENNLASVQGILPELLVGAGFLAALVYDFLAPKDPDRRGTGYIALVGLLAASYVNVALMVKLQGEPATGGRPLFNGMVVADYLSMYAKFVLLLGTFLAVMVGLYARELYGKSQGEFFLLAAGACIGGMFLCSSTNLLMIYLSIETLSILSYAMAGYLRRDRKSAEAGMKYVIYGALASGVMIFGMSYLYGLTGSLDLQVVAQKIRGLKVVETQTGLEPSTWNGAVLAVLGLVFVGFLYKIAAAPFHYWSPDVYEGSPTTATGFFSVVPKAAGFIVLIRVTAAFFPLGTGTNTSGGVGGTLSNTETVFAIIAVLTMTIGNLSALGQTNAKRMLAFSSIAHAGYMLAALSTLDDERGAAAILYYLLVYLFMNLGAFMVLVALENRIGSTDLKDLAGAIKSEKVLSVCSIVFLFSLTGLPPLAGFMAKYQILYKLADRNQWLLILFIAGNSVVSLFYYIKLAKTVSIDPQAKQPDPETVNPPLFPMMAVASALALLLLFFDFDKVAALCQNAAKSLLALHENQPFN